jgi:hypothetical protein
MGGLRVLLEAVVQVVVDVVFLALGRALEGRRREVVLVERGVLLEAVGGEVSLVEIGLGGEGEVVVVGLEHDVLLL